MRVPRVRTLTDEEWVEAGARVAQDLHNQRDLLQHELRLHNVARPFKLIQKIAQAFLHGELHAERST